MTLASEDVNSKLLDVVSVADFDAKECVDDNLVEFLQLNICQENKLMFCQDFEAIFCQDANFSQVLFRFGVEF